MTNNYQLSALYVAVFNRAPDQAGLSFWEDAMDAGHPFAGLAESFTSNALFIDTHQGSTRSFVESIYQNAFGQRGDEEGMSYWIDQLDQGNISNGDFIENVLSTSLNYVDNPENPHNELQLARKAALENKIEAAQYFTSQLGEASNPAPFESDSQLPTDAAFNASINAVKNVGSSPESLTEAKLWIEGIAENGIPPMEPSEPVAPTDAQGVFNALSSEQKAAAVIISVFNRAPDSEELEYWSQALDEGLSVSNMIESAMSNPSFMVAYNGLNTAEFIDEIYLNILNQKGSPEITAQWVDAIDNGSVTKAQFIEQFVTAIMGASEDFEGAQNALNLNRKELFSNKIEVALHYAKSNPEPMAKDEGSYFANDASDPAYQAAEKAISNITNDEQSVIDAIAGIDFENAPLGDALDLLSEANDNVGKALFAVNELAKENAYDKDFAADEAGLAQARAAVEAVFEQSKADAIELPDPSSSDGQAISAAFSQFIGSDKDITESNLSTVAQQVQNAISGNNTLLYNDGGTFKTVLDVNAQGKGVVDISLNAAADQVLNLGRLNVNSLSHESTIDIDFGATGGADTLALPNLSQFTGTATIENLILGDSEQADTLVMQSLSSQFSTLRVEQSGAFNSDNGGMDTAIDLILVNAKGGSLTLKGSITAGDLLSDLAAVGSDVSVSAEQLTALLDAFNGDLALGESLTVTTTEGVETIEVNKFTVNSADALLGENLTSHLFMDELERVDVTLSELQSTLAEARLNTEQVNSNTFINKALNDFIQAGELVSGSGSFNAATQIEAIKAVLDAFNEQSAGSVAAQAEYQAAMDAIDALESAMQYQAKAEQWFDDNGYEPPMSLTEHLTATAGNDIMYYAGEQSNGIRLTDFGKEGVDTIYFGQDKAFSLVELESGASFSSAQGDVATNEVFWQQQGEDLVLHVENTSYAGNESHSDNISTITLLGVDASQINADDLENGFLSIDAVA